MHSFILAKDYNRAVPHSYTTFYILIGKNKTKLQRAVAEDTVCYNVIRKWDTEQVISVISSTFLIGDTLVSKTWCTNI